MKLYILTEINIFDYEMSQRTPMVFTDKAEAEKAFEERAKELYDEIKDNEKYDFDKGRRSYCQYIDGEAARESDTLEIFEVEL